MWAKKQKTNKKIHSQGKKNINFKQMYIAQENVDT